MTKKPKVIEVMDDSKMPVFVYDGCLIDLRNMCSAYCILLRVSGPFGPEYKNHHTVWCRGE